ncbi:MAG: GLPGLI family protein [Agriterribacter sp.]
MKRIGLILCGLISVLQYANAQFILKGKIEYEKTVNQHKQLTASVDDDDDLSWINTIKKQIPEFKHNYYNLLFSDNKMRYEPGRESNEKTTPWGEPPANDNVIYSDFTNVNTTVSKHVFEESFLIQDSVKKYKWHITNDTRKIAGFECRRATTVIMDSIFVVAFYTDEIVLPGGPESFNGLPGMILGVVIPRLYTNWYATKVELDVKEATIAPPKKGKNTSFKGMEKTVQDSLKKWGKWGARYIWQIMI